MKNWWLCILKNWWF